MVPANMNRIVASNVLEEVLHAWPKFLGIKSFVRRIYLCLIDDRMRVAIM